MDCVGLEEKNACDSTRLFPSLSLTLSEWRPLTTATVDNEWIQKIDEL